MSGLGAIDSSALRFSKTRGRTGGSADYGLQYPSPFFDVGHTYLPATVKQLFRWCRYYFLVNPLINAVVSKMSEYPITDILLDTDRLELKDTWSSFLNDQLHYRSFQIEIGLDYHCLAGSTRVVTRDGVFPIRELAGKTVDVLTQGGVFRSATFKSYGYQQLWEVHTGQGVIYATKEHEWYVQIGNDLVKRTTDRLKGKSIPRVVAERPPQNDDFWEGVRHGVVFGDGTLSNEGKQAHVILHTQEKRYLAKYFEGHATITPHHEDKYLGVYGLPPRFKQLPEDVSASYWYGFTCGMLATDGCVDNRGQPVLTQKDPAVLCAISERLPWIGLCGGHVREHRAWNMFTKQIEPMNYLSLYTQYMREEDFIRPDQKKGFLDNYESTSYGQYTRVKSVAPTNRVEEVFCCVEPKTHTFVIEGGVLTGNCYGNALVSIFYPFVKLIGCKQCGFEKPATDATYRFTNFEFHWTCEKCDHFGVARVRDHYIRAPKGIRLLRWNPEDVDIRYNDISGEYEYYYTIPVQLKNDIIIGKKSAVETIPQLFIDALRLRKAVVFSRDNIYHFKRPTLAGKDRGWGTPMILPVLKDTFYLQILRKAQECVSPSTLIETSNGLVQADDVRVGDFVRTHTGQWHPVEKKWYRDAREDEIGRQITLTGLRPLPSVYSPHHPVMTIRRTGENRRSDTKDSQRSMYILRNPHLYEEVLCPAEQLEVGDYALYPRRLPVQETVVDVVNYTGLTSTDAWVYSGCGQETAEAFETLEQGGSVPRDNAARVAKRALKEGRTPKRMAASRPMTSGLAYILGWYAGDGSCGSRHVAFSLGKKDDPTRLIAAIKQEFDIDATIESSESLNTVVMSDVIVRQLIKGLISGGSKTKQAPREILNGIDIVKLEYLRGLWEADGHMGVDNGTLATASREQAYDGYRLLLHFGCIASVRSVQPAIGNIDGREIKGTGSYHVSVCGQSFERFQALLAGTEAPEIVSGKSGFFWRDYFATRICAVEEIEEEQYIDFKVAVDTTFCTPGTATKNSIALEHIVPLRVLFPQTGSQTSDPYCIALDSLVETRTGIKPAGEVQQGELLKTHKGEWRPVEYVVDRPIKSGECVYEFHISSLSAFPFKVSEEHPLLAVKRQKNFQGYDSLGEPSFIKAQDIEDDDFVCYPRCRTTWENLELDLRDYHPECACTEQYVYRRFNQSAAEIYEFFEWNGVPEFDHGDKIEFLADRGWEDKDYLNARATFTQHDMVDRVPRYLPVTEDLAYLIGLYTAEGSKKGEGASLSLNANETAIMDRVDRVLEKLGYPVGHRYTRDNSTQYDISDIFIGGLLNQVCGAGAQNKRFPRFITEAPDRIALRAVEGVFAGDGCSFKTTTRREGFKTVSPQLAIDVRTVLISYGLIANVQRNVPKENEIAKLPYYQVNLNGSQGDALQRLFKGDLEATGFSRCGFMRGKYVYLRINRRLEAPDVKTVRGFQIEGDKSFCVVGVATHNTTVNLQDWRDQIAGEIRRWRSDNNYIPILPLPIGQQTIGGDGRALLLSQEIRVWSEHIIAGMGVPVELIFGGLSYCQAPDTLVFTSHGLETLEEITPEEEGRGVSDRKVISHLGIKDVLQTHNVGNKKAARLTTRLGLELTAAHTHPVCVLQPDLTTTFKTMEELRPGDCVAVKAGANLWPKDVPTISFQTTKDGNRFDDVSIPETLTPELARLLGYLIAEGSCTESRRIGFGNSDQEVNTDFADCVESVFGYRIKFHHNRSMPTSNKPFYQTEISKQQAVEFLLELGVGGYADEKTVPKIIRNAPKHLVSEFIKAYFEGDGGVSDVDEKQCIAACSASGRLLQEIQLLLLNMGIVSSRYAPGAKPTFVLQIRSDNVDYFAQEIGFVSSTKSYLLEQRTPTKPASCAASHIPYLKERLEEFRDRHFENRSSWQFEAVDVELTQDQYTVDEIAALVDRERSTVVLHIQSGALTATKQPKIQGRFGGYLIERKDLHSFLQNHGLGRRRTTPKSFWGMSYEKLAARDLSFIREKEPDLAQRIENLAEARFIWDSVKELELLDVKIPMRDLTVEGASSYQGNGIISHNSGSNVSLRMLENMFLGYLSDQQTLLKWVISRTSSYLGWAPVKSRFKPFKMADDLQRKAYLFQLNQSGKLSDESLLADADYDSAKEDRIMEHESTRRVDSVKKQRLLQAEMEGEASSIQQKWQSKIQNKQMAEQTAIQTEAAKDQMAYQGQMQQQMMQDQLAQQSGQAAQPNPALASNPRNPELLKMPAEVQSPLTLQSVQKMPTSATNEEIAGGMNVDILSMAKQLADRISRLHPGEKPGVMQKLQASSPELYAAVMGLNVSGGNGPSQAAEAAARPLPTQKPARRGPEAQLV